MTKISALFQKISFPLQQGLWALHRHGLRVFLEKVRQRILGRLSAYLRRMIHARGIMQGVLPASLSYADWITENEPTEDQLSQQRLASGKFPHRPRISIVLPLFNTPLPFLMELFQSVFAQTYDQWELCIANGSPENKPLMDELDKYAKKDARIRIVHLEQNLGISGNSNKALALADGEYVALLDHDDTLAPFALFEVVALLQDLPETDLIYSDHDYLSTDGQTRLRPLFKPDWSPEIMLSANYITHLTVVRTSLVRQVGGFDPSTDGAQDWDLFFRIMAKTNHVAHISKVLYHWRETRESTAKNVNAKPYAVDAQLHTLTRYLETRGLTKVESFPDPYRGLRVRWFVPQEKVSIIIPAKGLNEHLRNCLAALVKNTRYGDYEIIIVNYGPQQPKAPPDLGYIIGTQGIKILHYEGELNYSRMNNLAVAQARGKYVLLLNKDTQVISGDWLEEMTMWASQPEIGAVGAKLCRPNGLIQHAGVIVGMGGLAGHVFADEPENSSGIFGSTNWYRNYSALTTACLMIRKEVYDKVGGLNEALLQNGIDVEFGLRLGNAGYRLLYDPFLVLKYSEAPPPHGKIPAQDFRTSYIYTKNILAGGDPFFNPNLSYWSTRPSLGSKHEKSPLQFVEEYLAALSTSITNGE